jgi:hypothetical protein
VGKPSDTGEGEASRPGTLDDGFNLIAKDLDRAFCLGLSTNQAVIMNCVREQSWTASLLARRKGEPRPQPVPAKVNLTHLAADAGLNRSSLSLALKALIAGGLLACTEGGHLIKKDYSKWLDDDGKEPRFTAAQLRFIRAAKTPKKGLRISDIDTQLPLQSATVGSEMNGDIDTQLPLQSATAEAESAENVAKRNGEPIGSGLPLQSATVGDESAVAKRNSAVGALLQSATATVAKRNSAPLEERTAEDFLDLNSLPLSPASVRESGPTEDHPSGVPGHREPEDLALVREAITLLGSSPNTEQLGMEVGRVHNSATNVRLAGWRWVVAAYAACESSGHVGDGPMQWKYFFGIVKGARRSEYDKIRAGSAPDPGPATPGELSRLPRKRTQAEERKAQSEAIRRAVAAIPDDSEEA